MAAFVNMRKEKILDSQLFIMYLWFNHVSLKPLSSQPSEPPMLVNLSAGVSRSGVALRETHASIAAATLLSFYLRWNYILHHRFMRLTLRLHRYFKLFAITAANT